MIDMTTTIPAAALLRDVPLHDSHHDHGGWMYRAEVLAALSRALDPAIAEQAVEVLEGVTPGPWVYEYTGIGHTVRQPGAYNAIFTVNHAGNFEQDARFIAWCRESVPALLAQNAALRAQVRESALQELASLGQAQEAYEAQKAAEAEVEKLRGALQIARVHVANNAEGWSVSRGAARDDLTIVDAALTTEERK